ncbi:MAG: hypothetical protein ACJAZN_002766 [Planctomycetota bacterium]|jgi:hypothetical protein
MARACASELRYRAGRPCRRSWRPRLGREPGSSGRRPLLRTGVSGRGLHRRGQPGPVQLLHNSVLIGPPPNVGFTSYPNCGIGLSRHEIRSSQAVSFVDCMLWGRDGLQPGFCDGVPGEHALVVEDSRVTLYGSDLHGGDGVLVSGAAPPGIELAGISSERTLGRLKKILFPGAESGCAGSRRGHKKGRERESSNRHRQRPWEREFEKVPRTVMKLDGTLRRHDGLVFVAALKEVRVHESRVRTGARIHKGQRAPLWKLQRYVMRPAICLKRLGARRIGIPCRSRLRCPRGSRGRDRGRGCSACVRRLHPRGS